MSRLIQADVSLDAIRHNLAGLRERLGPRHRICAVVKSNAYGHGIEGVWRAFAEGADMMAVATADEAGELRALGYEGPLLVLFCARAWTGTAAGHRDLVDLTHVADVICLDCGWGLGRDGLQYHLDEDAAARLDLKAGDADEAAAQVMTGLEELLQVFTPNPEGKSNGVQHPAR